MERGNSVFPKLRGLVAEYGGTKTSQGLIKANYHISSNLLFL